MSASFSDSDMLGVSIIAFKRVIREIAPEIATRDVEDWELKAYSKRFLAACEEIYNEVEIKATRPLTDLQQALGAVVNNGESQNNIDKMKQEIEDGAKHRH